MHFTVLNASQEPHPVDKRGQRTGVEQHLGGLFAALLMPGGLDGVTGPLSAQLSLWGPWKTRPPEHQQLGM